jgi:hypothetical protein
MEKTFQTQPNNISPDKWKNYNPASLILYRAELRYETL